MFLPEVWQKFETQSPMSHAISHWHMVAKLQKYQCIKS